MSNKYTYNTITIDSSRELIDTIESEAKIGWILIDSIVTEFEKRKHFGDTKYLSTKIELMFKKEL